MISLRFARELTYQLQAAQEHERLANALAEIPFFLTLFKGEERSNFLTLWQQLATNGHLPENHYPLSLDALRKNISALLPDALQNVQGLLEYRGMYALCYELLTELLEWAAHSDDLQRMMEAEQGLGSISRRRGDYAQAMSHLSKSLQIAESLSDTTWIANLVGSIGTVHFGQGNYDSAMTCYTRHLQLSESVGDKRGMSRAIGNMGTVHGEHGRYSEALECINQQYAIREALGDRSGMSIALCNMGITYENLGRYTEAMECYKRDILLDESLGDQNGLGNTIGNMGALLLYQGRLPESMACFDRHRSIAESLGDKRGVANAIGNKGSVLWEQGLFVDALAAFREALDLSQKIGFLAGTMNFLLGAVRTMLEMSEEQRVASGSTNLRESADECLRICQELAKPSLLFESLVFLARIDTIEGNMELGRQKLEAMLAEETDETQIAELHYWLWRITTRQAHQNEALLHFSSLYPSFPRFEFLKRIAELKGEPIPMSADDLPVEL